MAAQVSSNDCDFCEFNKRKASLYCDECEKFLCIECKRSIHDKVPIIQDHIVVDIKKTGGRVIKRKPVCLTHKQTFLYYCSKCECLTCKQCMTSSHNGHTTDTIKKIVDVFRENAKETHDKLKAKVAIVKRTLVAIKTNQTHKITSDFDSYVHKVEKICREMYGIVDHTKKIHMTAASDFKTNENQDLNRKRVFFQRQYDESSNTLIQIDNLLQESQDVTFFTDWKRLKTDVDNMIQIDQALQSPRRIESFNEDNFMTPIIGEIDKRLKRSMFKEKETEIEYLTNEVKKTETEIQLLQNAVKEHKILTYNLQKENNDLNKGLRKKQAEIEKLSRKCWGSSTINARYRYSAAIDIGSSYSGYAYSSNDDYTQEPTKINTNLWSGSKLLSLKAPTALLLDSSQEFVAFGYEAENMYSELVSEGEHEDYYYFHSFKMILHQKRITADIKIKDELGKEIEALKVFQYAIKFLKDHLFKSISDKRKGIMEKDLHYVLTAPAIWETSAKQFMREAATLAGIRSRQLCIALEPEAASIYCQHFKTDSQYSTDDKDAFAQTIKAGLKFMVVDLGGGTADITVHQRHDDGTLKEVVPPSCGPCGGKSIDEAFHSFLKRICGPKVMEELKKTELEDFIDLFREFESKKRSIRLDQTNKVVITLPVALIVLVKSHRGKMETALEQSPYGQAVSYSKQKLHISPELFRDLFKSTAQALIKHLEQMFRNVKLSDLKSFIIVGGFSECELIQHRMKETFGKHKKIIIPEEAGLAVLKGAVLYGHQPKAISATVLHHTYGFQCCQKWDPEKHPKSGKVNIGGVDQCKDVFYKFVKVGQQVETGIEESHVFKVLKPDAKTIECTIYVSTDTNPRYVTDPSCQRLGNVIIPLPEITAGQVVEIEGTMVFGGTELVVLARELHTGRVVVSQFDFI
ncbi:heat shock 70 kDa protein 12A-like [Mytilus trossulus]|uniref:heat shock 70 kDa protein 12A-like n=1 Tax=Mytilus trossulus TaxID=6551 RepID=UPI0030044235